MMNFRLYLAFPILTILIFISAGEPVHASTAVSDNILALCVPEVYQPIGIDCLDLGPSQYIQEMAAVGITFPLRSAPGYAPPPELRAVPNLYARVVSDGSPVFGSLEDAVAGASPLYILEAGFDYVTYLDRAEVSGGIYYMIDHGIWMRGGDMSRISAMPSFQGRLFSATPTQDFGWALFETQSQRTPGAEGRNAPVRTYYRYNMVLVYKIVQVDDQDWYLIGPDEWIEGRLVDRVTPNPSPPEGVENNRWVEVNLAEQTLAVYEDRNMVFATVMASGVPGQWTQPGLFQAYKKKANETMSGSFTADRSDFYYLEDVPWTIYFDQARALHGTYWHNSFGIPQSRGCVNLSTGDARWVFEWIQEGDWIYVWDPTGQTPTDPALYGGGGA
jgi:hypothetical protein